MAKKGGGSKKKRCGSSGVMVCGPSKTEERSISTRKIDNGYITRESTYARGKWTERETFTPFNPKVEITVNGGKET